MSPCFHVSVSMSPCFLNSCLHVSGIPQMKKLTNIKQQLPFVCWRQKMEMANFHLFAANGNGKQKFVFLGWQVTKQKLTIAVLANFPNVFLGWQVTKQYLTIAVSANVPIYEHLILNLANIFFFSQLSQWPGKFLNNMWSNTSTCATQSVRFLSWCPFRFPLYPVVPTPWAANSSYNCNPLICP